MKQIIKRLKTRSFDRVFYRLYSIAKRYGYTAKRYESYLSQFVTLAAEHGAAPTFPVTADVLERHPRTVQKIQDLGAEFAVHGYRHIDYSLLGLDEFRIHLEKARDIFAVRKIICKGFRFPYLKRTADHISQLGKCGFNWDSSTVVSWEVDSSLAFGKVEWENYQRILETYSAAQAFTAPSLPAQRDGLIEIPVSVPDDDILIERLEIDQEDVLFSIWYRMFEDVYKKGELLTLQLHPERYMEFTGALERLLIEISGRGDVWFATLSEIAAWWRKRQISEIQVTPAGDGSFSVTAPQLSTDDITWHGDTEGIIKPISESSWIVRGPRKPVIGLSPSSGSDVAELLESGGFVHEYSEDRTAYSLYLPQTVPADRRSLHEIINKHPGPLMKRRTWPQKAVCAVALTGDVDCITVFDFFNRIHG